MSVVRRAIAVAAVTASGVSAAAAQGSREPLFEQLAATFQKPYLTIGALLQVVGDFQGERSFAGNNGFGIANMRLRLEGNLDGGFGYFLQTNFASSPAILDASMRYAFAQPLMVEGGLFKAPFSREFLTSAASIDFVNRSQVVTALAPGRQIGAQLRGWLAANQLSYGIGAFNGNLFGPNGNDNNDLLYAARLALWPLGSHDSAAQLEIAVSGAHSQDESVSLGGGFLTGFRGERTLVGVDARLTRGPVLASAEAIFGRLDFEPGGVARPEGWHVTAGHMVGKTTQLLLRWDAFRPDGIAPDRDLLIVGLNHWPTRATEVQVNYVIPADDGALKRHQILVNAQVSF